MESPDETITRLERTLSIERERHVLDCEAYEKQRNHLLQALHCADTRSLVMRAETVTHRELLRFQKLVLMATGLLRNIQHSSSRLALLE